MLSPHTGIFTPGPQKELWCSLSNSIRLCASESVAISVPVGWSGQLSAPCWSPRGNSLVCCLSSCEPPRLQPEGQRGLSPLWHAPGRPYENNQHKRITVASFYLLIFFLRDYHSLRTEVKLGSKSLIFSLYDENKIHKRRNIVYVKYRNKCKCHIKKYIVDPWICFHIFLFFTD